MGMDTENERQLRQMIKRVASQVRITKVVATRSIKSKSGDHFVAFAAGWDTVQEDASGPGADVALVLSDRDLASNGFTLQEAMVAELLVAMKANIAVYRNARAAGSISADTYERAVRAVKNNFSLMVREVAEKAIKQE